MIIQMIPSWKDLPVNERLVLLAISWAMIQEGTSAEFSWVLDSEALMASGLPKVSFLKTCARLEKKNLIRVYEHQGSIHQRRIAYVGNADALRLQTFSDSHIRVRSKVTNNN